MLGARDTLCEVMAKLKIALSKCVAVGPLRFRYRGTPLQGEPFLQTKQSHKHEKAYYEYNHTGHPIMSVEQPLYMDEETRANQWCLNGRRFLSSDEIIMRYGKPGRLDLKVMESTLQKVRRLCIVSYIMVAEKDGP